MRTLFVFNLLLLTACGHSDDPSNGDSGSSSSSSSYKYQLIENNCDTGEHTADSLSKECNMLKDDGLNKGCAYDLRKDKFQTDGCGNWNS
jgi:major membrane immunogen (membrane-anchored lipoprotein)